MGKKNEHVIDFQLLTYDFLLIFANSKKDLMETKYNPQDKEQKWYDYWQKNQFFRSVPDEREPFTIVIPPPNVTGVLHMGHMLNNTIQDILIRRARMQGKNACWVPGTDHAAIATEAKVVQLLRGQGIKKTDIGRAEFLKHAFAWKEKYGGTIVEQIKMLGCSCDWERLRFTMEDSLSDAVLDSFIHLHKKGMIYRDLKMVNWDVEAQTAVSNEEVNHTDENSKLYYIKYAIKDSADFLTVATVRPETIMGDVAVAVNPNDERYKHLIGKKVIVPFVGREVPIIADDYVDLEFGTGCLKVTPAHDVNDYEIGKRHNLEVIDVFNADGTISAKAAHFVGLERFKARKEAAKELEETGLLLKTEDIVNKVGRSERTNAIIEPRLSLQWFVKMDELVKPALENVLNDNIQFFPERFKNLYRHWLENIRDWPISRQLWWGQQIPAWYDEEGGFVVAKTHEEALAEYKTKYQRTNIKELRQDEDVLDTWFSSWLWPISVFDGFKNPQGEINYYYPTSVLVTGWDIIFFWVARMIFAGYEFKHEKPFEKVYFTGMVRDKQRRKMSKSLGNSPDTFELINTFGADGVRFGVMSAAPAGNDSLFDEKHCEQGRNFTNKLWNALRLVKGWELTADANVSAPTQNVNETAGAWFEARLNETIVEMEKLFDEFKLSEALMTLYKLIWDDFCSWYLEMVKPEFGKPISEKAYNQTINFFERLMQLAHPFMPFITEEIWFTLREREEKNSICVSSYPKAENFDKALISQGETAFEIIAAIREIRAKAQKKNHETVNVFYKVGSEANDNDFIAFKEIIAKLAKIEAFARLNDVVGQEKLDKQQFGYTRNAVVKAFELLVETGEAEVAVDIETLKKELAYTEGFLKSVDAKLTKERFMANAKPDVIANEQKKKDDALQKIKALKESIGAN